MVLISIVGKIKEKIINQKANLFTLFLSAVAATLIYKAVGLIAGELIKLGLLVCVLLYFLFRYKNLSDFWKSAFWGYLIFLSGFSLFMAFKVIKSDILHPQEWDFLCFYLYGKVALNGMNFYLPANYLNVLNSLSLPFSPSPDFINGALVFQYFPPNIFYFIPLGLFNYNFANHLWLTINILFLFIDIYLIYKFFFKSKGLLYLLSVLSLSLLLPCTHYALFYEHNTFIFLLFVLLIWKSRDFPRSGIWLSFAMFAKPILVILFIYPIFRRKWKTIIIAAITALIISLVTLIIFGPTVFISFFTSNPNLNVPNSDYTEWTNQSLLSTILRITHYNFSYVTPLIHPLFLISSLILCGISFWITFKIEEDKSSWAFAIILLLALMIYPGSINSYGPMIMPVVIFLLSDGEKLYYNKWLYPVAIASIYMIMFVNPFLSYLTFWVMLIFIIVIGKNAGIKIELLKKLKPKFQ
jgi:hypothetical protein